MDKLGARLKFVGIDNSLSVIAPCASLSSLLQPSVPSLLSRSRASSTSSTTSVGSLKVEDPH